MLNNNLLVNTNLSSRVKQMTVKIPKQWYLTKVCLINTTLFVFVVIKILLSNYFNCVNYVLADKSLNVVPESSLKKLKFFID